MLSDRARVGEIFTVLGVQYGECWYEVDFDGSLDTVGESDLTPYQLDRSPTGLLAARAFGGREDLLRLMTFFRLHRPIENVVYSLEASRTEFYPHQYKPLLKILSSWQRRLLIADEVGLGKTIEAGLIMIELRERGFLDQALVVCPAALCRKWQDEMWRRFDERFEILDSAGFRTLLKAHAGGSPPQQGRHIISLSSLRHKRNQRLLSQVPLHLDLLVVDEAHHIRNPYTQGHKVCAELAETSDAVLFLTATPIQLGSENLFNLLRILDPVEFSSLEVFDDRLRANAPIVEAQTLARRPYPPPFEEIEARLRSLRIGPSAPYFRDSPFLDRVLNTLSEPDLSRREVALLREDLEDLNLLSHVFSRTKKRDVHHDAPERDARIVGVRLSETEMKFYEAVTQFVRQRSKDKEGQAGVFSELDAQRQVASSIQATKTSFLKQAVVSGLNDPNDDRSESEEPAEFELSEAVLEAGRALGDRTDSKYDELRTQLELINELEPGAKVMVFAYYRATLKYLQKRLAEDGITCELIHGGVLGDPVNPEYDERGRRIERFQFDQTVRVLLSSEVGSEGLDFQFCHYLVNYDLPWNPMKVEQRIGRLDRLGQEAEKIQIINFSPKGTIEERVLERLHKRIGIFEQSIGDLETILGDEIQTLERDLLTQSLTPEQEAERIERTADAIQMRKAQMERLESEAAEMVGVDTHLEQEIERIRAGGQLITADDRYRLIQHFLAARYRHARLELADIAGVHVLTVPFELEDAIRRLDTDPMRLRFLNRLRERKCFVTFDADVAFEHRQVEFLNNRHPLLRLGATYFNEHKESLHPVSGLTLAWSSAVRPGGYLYALFAVTVLGGRERTRLEPMVVPANGVAGEIPDEFVARRFLNEIIRGGQSARGLTDVVDPERLGTLLSLAKDEYVERLEAKNAEFTERNEARIRRRHISVEQTFGRRIEREEDLLRRADRKGLTEQYKRLVRARLRKAQSERDRRLQEVNDEREIRTEHELVACGIVEVVEGRPDFDGSA